MKSLWFQIIILITINLLPLKSWSQEKEAYRPQFHFTPQSKWMNDPNGLVYYAGEYHLFYQYFPDSTVWGPMHWGHAVSRDLVHWDRLPIALYPDSLGYIFSGSAVMDLKNTSGLGTMENPAMVAIFAYHNPKIEKSGGKEYQYQGMAFSLDKGRTWKKYTKNPILKNPGIPDFRDPKVSWNEAVHKWIMVLAAGDKVQFYSSANLLEWTFESEFGQQLGAHGGVWECPDLIPMKVQGTRLVKWVLLVSINPGGPNGGSATQYFVGDFNGHVFNPVSSQSKWIDYGKDNYAGVTWSNIPDQENRTLFLGWMSNWEYATRVPTVNWRSAMTFPRELILQQENDNYMIISQPVRELASIRGQTFSQVIGKVNGKMDISREIPFKKSPIEISIKFKIPGSASAGKFGILFRNSLSEEVKLGFDRNKNQVYINRTRSGISDFSNSFGREFSAPCNIKGDQTEMHILVDVASIELFAQGGTSVLTDIFFPHESYDQIVLFSEEGEIIAEDLKICELHPIW